MENMYIHIGLHKTGTTYFQRFVFPNWKGVDYLTKLDIEQLVSIDDHNKFLISNEGLCGNPWEGYMRQEIMIKNLARFFPQAKIIISFRRHDHLICSFYKQYLHEGGTIPFGDFSDIENDSDNSIFKKESLSFIKIVNCAEKYFDGDPFIFLQEEMKKNLDGVLNDLELFIGGEAPNVDYIIANGANRGVGYYQSKLLMLLNRLSKSPRNKNGFLPWYNMYTNHFKCTPRHICQFWLSSLSNRSLTLNKKQQESILDYYSDDWNYILKYLHDSNYRKHFNLG